MRKGDGLDAARLLLPDFRNAVCEKLGADRMFAIPHRDALFACAKEHKSELQMRVREDYARAPHAITPELFSLDRL